MGFSPVSIAKQVTGGETLANELAEMAIADASKLSADGEAGKWEIEEASF